MVIFILLILIFSAYLGIKLTNNLIYKKLFERGERISECLRVNDSKYQSILDNQGFKSSYNLDLKTLVHTKSFLGANATPTVIYKVFVDYDKSKIAFVNLMARSESIVNVFDFSEIIKYDIYESGEKSISSGSAVGRTGKHGYSGGVYTGQTTQFIDGMDFKITLKTIIPPTFNINIIDVKTAKTVEMYSLGKKFADDLKSLLDNIIAKKEDISREIPVIQQTDEVEQILKYKSLLDSGIITNEEFEEKKKQLMNVDKQ